MGAEHAGEGLLAVKGNPRELAAVVVQKTRSEADALVGGDVDPGRVVVRTVEILYSKRIK